MFMVNPTPLSEQFKYFPPPHNLGDLAFSADAIVEAATGTNSAFFFAEEQRKITLA